MTWPIGPCAVVADVLILLALVAAVASSTNPTRAQPFLATIAFACAWILAGSLDALHAPAWTMSMSGAMIAASVAAVAVTLHLSRPQGGGGADGPGHDDDGRGGRGGPPQYGPRGGGADGDPSWWPAFEREFARYVAVRERKQRQVALPAAR